MLRTRSVDHVEVRLFLDFFATNEFCFQRFKDKKQGVITKNKSWVWPLYCQKKAITNYWCLERG